MYKLLHRVWSTQKSRVCRTGFLYDECCAVQSHRSINAAHDHAVRLGRFFFEQPRWNRRDDDRCGAVAFSLSSQAVLRTNLRLGASVSIKRRVVMRWISPFLHGRESQGVSDRQCIDERPFQQARNCDGASYYNRAADKWSHATRSYNTRRAFQTVSGRYLRSLWSVKETICTPAAGEVVPDAMRAGKCRTERSQRHASYFL